MKQEIRVIGIDDSPFNKFHDQHTLIIGTVYRGGQFLDGLVSCECKVDGDDSTKNIARMINNCKFKPQLQAILLKGIAVGGFNIIDIFTLHQKTKLPIIIVLRQLPNTKKMFAALDKLNMSAKKKLIQQLPKPRPYKHIHYQAIGIDAATAERMLKITSTHSFIPEPLRTAHIIAAGIIKGESYGRA